MWSIRVVCRCFLPMLYTLWVDPFQHHLHCYPSNVIALISDEGGVHLPFISESKRSKPMSSWFYTGTVFTSIEGNEHNFVKEHKYCRFGLSDARCAWCVKIGRCMCASDKCASLAFGECLNGSYTPQLYKDGSRPRYQAPRKSTPSIDFWWWSWN